jgi:hypothetical protein
MGTQAPHVSTNRKSRLLPWLTSVTTLAAFQELLTMAVKSNSPAHRCQSS